MVALTLALIKASTKVIGHLCFCLHKMKTNYFMTKQVVSAFREFLWCCNLIQILQQITLTQTFACHQYIQHTALCQFQIERKSIKNQLLIALLLLSLNLKSLFQRKPSRRYPW